MFLRRIKIIAALLMLAALGSCKVNTINSFPSNPASMRYASFMPNAPAVDVKVQNVAAWNGVPFQTLTNYSQFDNVQTSIGVYQPDSTTAIAESSASFSAKATYTLVGFGTVEQPTLLFQADEVPNIGTGNTQLRVTHLGFGFGLVDVYVTAPGVLLTDVDPTYTLSYGGNTSFERMTAGTYEVRVCPYGSKSLMYDSGPIDLAVDASQGVYLYGISSTHSFNALLSSVVGGTTMPLPSRVAAIKIINLAYDVPNVDLRADGIPVVTNLGYNVASASYVPLVAGQRVFTFDATLAPDTVIAQVTSTIDPSTDSTIMVSGANGSLVATVMPDFNLPPDSSAARLRVVNASPDVPAFDVAVDDVVKATNVTYTTASLYFTVPSGNHTIKLLAPGTTTAIYTIDDRSYGGNNVYSVYLSGPLAALKNLVTQDNTQNATN